MVDGYEYFDNRRKGIMSDTENITFWSETDLYAMAATVRNIPFNKEGDAFSRIGEYTLDDHLLLALSERRITRMPDVLRSKRFMELSDYGVCKSGAPMRTRIWRFKRNEDGITDLRVFIDLWFELNRNQGVTLSPRVVCNGGSASNPIANFHFFTVLIENDDASTALCRELLQNEGRILVSWNEMGIDGVSDIVNFFKELTRENRALARVVSTERIFKPYPSIWRKRSEDRRVYFPTSSKPALADQWRSQLAAFLSKLSF